MHWIDEIGGIEIRTGFVTTTGPVPEWCKNYYRTSVPVTKIIVDSRIEATVVTNGVPSGFQDRAPRTMLLATTWLADIASELQHFARSLLTIPSTCRC
jgi:hypothetical protein